MNKTFIKSADGYSPIPESTQFGGKHVSHPSGFKGAKARSYIALFNVHR